MYVSQSKNSLLSFAADERNWRISDENERECVYAKGESLVLRLIQFREAATGWLSH